MFPLKWQPSDAAGPCKRETSRGMKPTNHKSTVERAASPCPGDPPTFGTDVWRENKEHVAEADRRWHYTSGQQEPESLIMSQLLGWMWPSAEITLAGWCSWQPGGRLLDARPFYWCVARKCELRLILGFSVFTARWPVVHEASIFFIVCFCSFKVLVIYSETILYNAGWSMIPEANR